jgi:hypothetical protein
MLKDGLYTSSHKAMIGRKTMQRDQGVALAMYFVVNADIFELTVHPAILPRRLGELWLGLTQDRQS